MAPLRRPSRTLARVSRIRVGLALTLALLALSACGGRAKNPFDSSPAAQSVLVVYVENRGFNDVRVYAVSARGAESIGTVVGNTSHRVNLNWRQFDQISFRIEVLAGRTYNTHAVPASPGDRIELIIPSDPSNAIIRPRTGAGD